MKKKQELDSQLADVINSLTQKLGDVMLKEYMKLPKDCQLGLVLIKTSQLLLANVLCQVAADKSELDTVTLHQGPDIKDLVNNCAYSVFANKFSLNKH